jgi:hypothetical protein
MWTIYILVRARPDTVVVMSPPPFGAIIAGTYCRLNRSRLLVDLHSGSFNNPKWSWSIGAVLKIAKVGTAIVTNETHRAICERHGVRAQVVHDPVPAIERPAMPSRFGRDFVLVPSSHASDEPLDVILDAAGVLSHITFVLTGRAASRTAESADRLPNVILSGYLSTEEFSSALWSAGLVLCLTTRIDTMQRGAYEALGSLKPLVTSDTQVLRSFFGPAAIYADNNSPSVCAAVSEALACREKLSDEMARLRQLRGKEDKAALGRLSDRPT